jgi:hypothetical protein
MDNHLIFSLVQVSKSACNPKGKYGSNGHEGIGEAGSHLLIIIRNLHGLRLSKSRSMRWDEICSTLTKNRKAKKL